MKIYISPKARQDLLTHAEFIEKDNYTAALRLGDSFNYTVKTLMRMPRIGENLILKKKPKIEFKIFPIHEFHNYLLVYQIINERVIIHRVFHRSQNILKILRDTPPPSP